MGNTRVKENYLWRPFMCVHGKCLFLCSANEAISQRGVGIRKNTYCVYLIGINERSSQCLSPAVSKCSTRARA